MPRLIKNSLAQGAAAEAQALQYLQQHGLILIDRNFRRPFGEIDLIMRDRTTLVFVEVRSRSSMSYGGAAASVSAVKQRRLRKAAHAYLQRFRQPPACRFDVLAIDSGTVTWLTNVMYG